MSEPMRLLDGDVEAEKVFLRAWQDRQPTDAARLRTLAALGVGGAVVTTTAGVAAAPKAAFLSASVLKWLGVVGGLVATAGVGYAVKRSLPGADPATVAAPVQVEAPLPPPGPVVAPLPAATPAAAPGVTPEAPAAAAAAPPKATAPSTLEEEVRAIDRARAALASGDASQALQRIDAYDARYPEGSLAQESAELRIEALFQAGKRAQGEKLAVRFLAAHPSSPYARVIRALVASPAPPTP